MDPESIAKVKRIDVETWEEFPAGCYGALVLEAGRFRIAVSALCPTIGHKRFTIAHELGHYHIEGHVDALLSDNGVHLSNGSNFRSRRDPYEIEADAFASELLIPRRFAQSFLRGRPPGLATVRALATTFQASLSCAGIRFAAMTEEGVAIVLSHAGRMEWVAASGAMRDQPWFYRQPFRGEWTPRNSGTARLFSDSDRISRGEEDSSSGLLSEWFPAAPHVEVCEEALGLGTFGRVLTVLTCPELPDPDEPQEETEPDRDWRDALRGYRLG